MQKSILITGSSRGIGAAVARLAKKEGYEVLLHGRTKSADLIKISKELDAKYFVFDVCDETEVKNQLAPVEKLDILINSAGINISKPFNDLSDKDWRAVYDVNVFGLANVTRNLIPQLNRSKRLGKIVNIGSIKGIYSSVGRVAYASSKAAVINLTTGLAKELAPKILVNAVAPGFTKTEMTDNTWSERIKNQVESILIKRMANPEEIANLVMFLSGENNNYITGQTIIIDGGFSIKND